MSFLHYGRRNKVLQALGILLAIAAGIIGTAFADLPQGTPRKIVSDDFTKNRPDASSTDSRSKESQKQSSKNSATGSQSKGSQGQSAKATITNPTLHRRTYRLASRPVIKSPRPTDRRRPSSDTFIPQLGITIWRLRPANANDKGTRALIREKSTPSGWVPERVEADTTFREGDHVRLSIESPHARYLYVIDRDLFADGTKGGAMLIYPWAGVDNEMRPGKLVDIPSQEDDPSYFTARLSDRNQVGELLTFIVTSSPLNLHKNNKPLHAKAPDN